MSDQQPPPKRARLGELSAQRADLARRLLEVDRELRAEALRVRLASTRAGSPPPGRKIFR